MNPDPQSAFALTASELSDAFVQRRYLHFDEPVSRSALEPLVTNASTVASWSFLPFLKSDIVTMKVKRKPGGILAVTPKSRPICYAAHKDAALFSLYSKRISKAYESTLERLGLTEAVTAFRRTNKCNIDLACESFNWIGVHTPCVALAFDVEKFFDTLDHRTLKSKWLDLKNAEKLEPDEFAVFRAITKYSFADRASVLQALGISRHNIRSEGRKRLCEPKQFRKVVRGAGLIQTNPNSFGIPQGSPISALLSNIYMLDADSRLNSFAISVGGLYRRYCDDILLVVPPEMSTAAKNEVEAALGELKLNIQSKKTLECHFPGPGSKSNPPLQYLGLVFDGNRILLRSSGIARYFAKMRAGVRLAKLTKLKYEREHNLPKGSLPLRKKKLRRKYTHYGNRNFITYALRASEIAKSASIRRQVRRHEQKLAEKTSTPAEPN